MLCFMATLSALSPLSDGVQVVVASRDLNAGTVLTIDDLETIAVPEQMLPHGWRDDPEALVGSTTTGPMTRGSILTTAVTRVGPDPGDGRVVVPFRVADASVVQLISVGDHITVVGGATDGSVVELASQVEVTALPAGDESWGASSGALVAVACDPASAARLAAAAGQLNLGIVLG